MRAQTAVTGVQRVRPVMGSRRSEVEFWHLLDNLPTAAYMCDSDGLITYFNQHSVSLWGRAPKLNDPVDRFCGSFKLYAVDGSPIAHDQCWMALALHERKEYNGHEIIVERPDGQRLTALAHANPILDDDGELAGAVNVLVDISDRKRTENLLREAHDRLSQQVVERTAELTELSQHLFQVTEDEKARLAGELHDEMGSILTLLALKLGDVGKRLSKSDPQLLAELKKAIELVSELIASQRRIVGSLRPVLLDTFGLTMALRQHVEEWSKSTGIPVKLDMPSALPTLAANAPLALFRMVQESLTNVAKYAHASLVCLTVFSTDRELTVCVEDDGVGMAPAVSRIGTSHGILGMRERLAQFGAKLVIGLGSKGRGVRVCAVLPITERE